MEHLAKQQVGIMKRNKKQKPTHIQRSYANINWIKIYTEIL